MIVSHSHRFIFIHVPKAAGSSIIHALEPHSHRPEQYVINRLLGALGIQVNHFGPYRWRRFRRHSSAQERKKHLPNSVYDQYFKFAFVRNPWDRLVSSYQYIRRKSCHRRHRIVRLMDHFTDYVRHEIGREKFHQTGLLIDGSGRIIVDVVGRFEFLQKHFELISRQIGVQVALPWITRTTSHDYREYYDLATARLVADHWGHDIDRFGYRFDGLAQGASEFAWVSDRVEPVLQQALATSVVKRSIA